MKIIAYLAASLDGYIADTNGSIDWLNSLPNPDESNFGFADFLNSIDAILMGANTFRTVKSIDLWPNKKPVFVPGNSIKEIPEGYQEKFGILSGDLTIILQDLEQKGFNRIYADGGIVVKECLNLNVLNELVITHIPVSLGSGVPLFPISDVSMSYENMNTEVLSTGLVEYHYRIIQRN